MKWINDHLGHARGDEALVETAAIFREVFRQSDTIARTGGDGFAVIALGSSADTPNVLEERLQRQVDLMMAGASSFH